MYQNRFRLGPLIQDKLGQLLQIHKRITHSLILTSIIYHKVLPLG